MMFSATTLLVEDEPSVADGYKRYFADAGLQLDVATTWDDAIAMFRVGGHALVIADYNLPGDRHGLELLIAMKRLVPSSSMVLISGAMGTKAAGIANQIEFIDGFYRKGPDAMDKLVNLARVEDERSLQPTDWSRLAAGYLKDPDIDDPLLKKIDDELRADVSRNKARRV